MKKILGVISIILVLLAGMFLYNGGKLLLVYQDYILGAGLVGVGIAFGILYGFSSYFAWKNEGV